MKSLATIFLTTLLAQAVASLAISAESEHAVGAELDAPSLTKRFGPICGGGPFNWGLASGPAIQRGISELRGRGGQPGIRAGPGACDRVTCIDGAAIWWCNDKTVPASLPGFNTIADCAQVLKNACARRYEQEELVVGQNFNGGDWNCIVRRDNC